MGCKRLLAAAALGALGIVTRANAAPIAAPGFVVSVFAAPPAGTSGADSVVQVGNHVYVGYSNGTPKDGSGGPTATSTIIEYNLTGNSVNSTTVVGHNDGLRYDPTTHKLWAMQNEDGNPNLVLVTPGSLHKSSVYSFSATPHGGGYDDVAFYGGNAYVTASNPHNNPNADPALSLATLGAGVVNVTGVLAGNAIALIAGTGAPTTLNLQDPDSLTVIPGLGILIDSQADGQLVLFNPTTHEADLLQLQGGAMADDTVLSSSAAKRTLLVADKATNIVYSLTGTFPIALYSAVQDASGAGFVGAVTGADGNLVPVLTGLGNPGGEQFLVPEPASFALAGMGVLGLAALRRRRA